MLGAHAIDVAKLKPAECSFYELATKYFNDHRSRDPFHQFLCWMRVLGAQSFLEEVLDWKGCAELVYEHAAAVKRSNRSVTLSAHRLSFFKVPANCDWTKETEVHNDDLLGYAVIVKYEFPDSARVHVLESVVAWHRATMTGTDPVLEARENYFIHCLRPQKTQVGSLEKSRHFAVRGSFFSQQNGFTNVCAHAAMRCAINSLAQYTGPKITNEMINQSLNLTFDDPSRYTGYLPSDPAEPEHEEGVRVPLIKRAIREITQGQFDTLSFTVNYDILPDFDRFVYPFVESGLPVILGINAWDFMDKTPLRHVLTIVGHTLNMDRWAPEAQAYYGQPIQQIFYPACEWTDHYVVNDDRQGMYATVHSDVLRPTLIPAKNHSIHPVVALALIPKKLAAGHLYERIAAEMLIELIRNRESEKTKPTRWEGEIRLLFNQNIRPILVARVVLKTRVDYLTTLYKTHAGENFTETQRAALAQLPELLWVCELTLPPIYTTNIKKFGEVLFDACEAAVTTAMEQDDAGSTHPSPAMGVDDAVAAATVLLWFDGIWSSRSGKGGSDWPIKGLVPLLRE
jgi:hypothetical protein